MAEAKAGSLVEISVGGKEYRGLLMPSADNKVLMLKLENGYNVGFLRNAVKGVNVLKKEVKLASFPEARLKFKKGLPKISIVATGGTIGSKVDYRTGGAHMLLKPEELLASVPELADIVSVKKILRPFSMASEDMDYRSWQRIAEAVAGELNSGAEGVIVTHGTDFLHYTAAALSFMLQNLGKPVAVVGAQRSSDRGSFDGALNLLCAAQYCKSDIAEVSVVMHGESADSYCLAIRGTKVRKMHTSRRDAFRPINEFPLAKVWPDGRIEVLNERHRKRNNNKIVLKKNFENKVALIKFVPGMDPKIIDFFISQRYKGLVIEAGALGHIASQPADMKLSWLPAVERAVKKGLYVGITSQCIYGAVHPSVYTNLRLLARAGAVHLKDMLSETAFVKLGWVLANSKNLNEAKRLMLENISNEFNERIEEGTFLY